MRMLLAVLLWSTSINVGAVLPDTPLRSVYSALFAGDVAQAWQRLILVEPKLDGDAQKTAWSTAATAIIAQQCGKNVALPIPSWLDQPTVRFIQRDMPLNRVYRVQIDGSSARRDLQITLTLPNGKALLNKQAPVYYEQDTFSFESPEIALPFSRGIYLLTVNTGTDIWQQPLILTQSEELNWVSLKKQQLHFTLPDTPASCPNPWIEQKLLRRDDFKDVWWKNAGADKSLQWPQQFNQIQDVLWANVTVIKAEAQGGVTVRQEHRFAGPFTLFFTPKP